MKRVTARIGIGAAVAALLYSLTEHYAGPLVRMLPESSVTGSPEILAAAWGFGLLAATAVVFFLVRRYLPHRNAAPASPRRFSVARVGVVIAELAIAGMIGIGLSAAAWSAAGTSRFSANKEKVARDGFAPEIPRSRPTPPEAENAAMLFQKAASMFPEKEEGPKDKRQTAIFSAFRDGRAQAADLAVARDLVKRDAAALAVAARGADAPKVNWEVDWDHPGFGMKIPHYSRFLSLARGIALQAIVQSRDGKPRDAIHTLREGFIFANAVADEPILVASMISVAVTRITCAAARVAFPAGPPASAGDSWGPYLQGERLQATFKQAVRLELIRGPEFLVNLSEKELANEVGSAVGPVVGVLFRPFVRFEQARNLLVGEEFLKSFEARYRDKATGDAAGLRLSRDTTWFGTPNVVPDFNGMREKFLNGVAELSVLRAAIAAKRIREASGKWPATVAEQDPFLSKPLTVRADGGGLVIYSIGSDGKDDGGAAWDYKTGYKAEKGDIGWHLAAR